MPQYERNTNTVPDDTPGGSTVRQGVKDQNSQAIDDLFTNLNIHSNNESGRSHAQIDTLLDNITNADTGIVPEAEAARDKAQEWATNPQNDPVETSPSNQYSALHHATNAAESASSATASATSASNSASAAATSESNAASSASEASATEQRIITEGNTQVVRVTTEGDTQVQRVTSEGVSYQSQITSNTNDIATKANKVFTQISSRNSGGNWVITNLSAGQEVVIGLSITEAGDNIFTFRILSGSAFTSGGSTNRVYAIREDDTNTNSTPPSATLIATGSSITLNVISLSSGVTALAYSNA